MGGRGEIIEKCTHRMDFATCINKTPWQTPVPASFLLIIEMWIPDWLQKFILSSQKSLDVSISSHVTIFCVVYILFLNYLTFWQALNCKSLNETEYHCISRSVQKSCLRNEDVEPYIGNTWEERYNFASFIVTGKKRLYNMTTVL